MPWTKARKNSFFSRSCAQLQNSPNVGPHVARFVLFLCFQFDSGPGAWAAPQPAAPQPAAPQPAAPQPQTAAAPRLLRFGETRPAKTASAKLTLSFAGDILVHEALYKKVIAEKKEDFSVLWEKITPLLEKADFSYANLEGPVARGINDKLADEGDIGFVYDGSVYSGTNMLFNFHPQIISALARSGFDIVSTANNHTFDRGSMGIDKTIDALRAEDFDFVGTRKKGTLDPFYTITPIGEFKIAWIACTEMLNGFKDRHGQVLLCYEQADEIVKLITHLKDQKMADAIVVLPHWGVEYKHKPNAHQIKHAHLYLEAGALIVSGSHPHVLQPVEKYRTKDGRETFIAYSLGNLVANQSRLERRASAIVYLGLSKNGAGDTWISSYSYEPTVRVKTEIKPAAHMKSVVQHVQRYLGQYAGGPVVTGVQTSAAAGLGAAGLGAVGRIPFDKKTLTKKKDIKK